MMKWFATCLLKMLGWTAVYKQPPTAHGIYLAYPHTSNWDFFYSLLWKFSTGVKVSWVAKESLFVFPIGIFMRAFGGVGISRKGEQDNVAALCNTMLSQSECWLAIAPEGTRSYQPYIKSGFYHIATTANVPLGIAFIDYELKQIGVRYYRYVMPTIAEELKQLAHDYQTVRPHDASKVCDLKLRNSLDDISNNHKRPGQPKV
jgi:hypothetical protein